MIRGNQLDALPASYKRYLTKAFTEKLGLVGTPLRLEFKQSDNPYKGQKNKLNERQLKQKRRMLTWAKT